MDCAFSLFDTVLGRCGIAWTRAGLVGVQLPEKTEDEMRARLATRAPGAVNATPPPWVRKAIGRVRLHLKGKIQNFAGVPLDFSAVPAFHRRVYEAMRAVAPGETRSYAELAKLAGSPKAARAVGQAMANNPLPIVVPCHRILASGGKVGGFSAYGGVGTKTRLLTLEGANLPAKASLFRGRGRLSFDAEEAVAFLSRADAKLARLMTKVGPFHLRLEGRHTPFLALAQSIVYQQLAGRAASSIFARFCALFSGEVRPTEVLAKSPEALRAAGLSRAKVLSIRDLAAKVLDGTVPSLGEMRVLSDEALVERLTTIRGVGRWTVEMLLIFRFGRPDVLPATDYGIRKGFALTYRHKVLPTPQALSEYGLRWKPYRTVASWYLWRALELGDRGQRAP